MLMMRQVSFGLIERGLSPAPGNTAEHGYMCGGYTGAGYSDVAQRFSFAVEIGSASIGSLTRPKCVLSGASSTTHGYIFGGSDDGNIGFVHMDFIEKYSFASTANAAEVASLTNGKRRTGSSCSETHAYIHGGNYAGSPASYTTTTEI